MIPQRHRAFLEAVPDLSPRAAPGDAAAVGRAALVTEIVRRYENALSANKVTELLLEKALHPVGASEKEVLDELVRPAFEAFRRGRLPLAEWWEPERLHLLVFTWYARWRVADIGERAAREELQERWGHGAAAADAVIAEASAANPEIPAILDAARSDTVLGAVWAKREIEAAVEHEIATLPLRIRVHDELWEMGLAIARYRVLVANSATLAHSVPDLDDVLQQTASSLRENILRFTAHEVSMLHESRDEDEELLHAAVNALRDVDVISQIGVNAPADGYLEGLLVPDWLTEYVVSAGGRIGHRSCGPIPYWYAVLELPEPPDELWEAAEPRLGIAVLEPDTGRAEYAVQLHFRGEERVAQFHFSDSVDQALQLALIALAAQIRIDFLLLSSDGLLELAHSARYTLHDSPLRAHIRAAALVALREQPATADELLNVWFHEHSADQGAPGFLASDWAKAEELLDLGVLRPDRSEVPRGLTVARDRWLTASDELARRRVVTTNDTDLRATVETARGNYQLAVGDVEPRVRHASEAERLASLVDGVVEEGRAFLHLNRSREHLDAFISFSENSAVYAERLEVSRTPLQEIEAAFDAWEDAEPDSLQRVVQAVGVGLGDAIAAAVREHRVQHLYISPVGFLNAVPFSVLSLSDGGRLGDLASVSYVPSAQALQGLHVLQPSVAATVLAVSSHEVDDIPLSSAESAAVARLYENAIVLDGNAATADAVLGAASGSRILHIACHGSWRQGEAYASGLHLAGPDPATAYLSVARLLRDADLRATELAVLSACDTGRSTTRWPEVHGYTGIDGAFLACGARTVISSLWEVHDLAGLLFSVALHEALVAGAAPSDAFTLAVDLLRSGRYEQLDGSTTAEVLDATAPTWRETVEEVGADLTDPFYWATFKLSGLP
jgi:CHAT domain-containing protein